MKVLICTNYFPHCAEVLRHYLPQDEIFSCPAEEVEEKARKADVLIPAMFRVDAKVIAQTSARLIHQFGVGLEGVDIPAATQRGIYVANVPGEGTGNAFSVAEHAVLLMLALARRFPEAQSNVRLGRLGAPLGTSLRGKTAGIIGVGSIGKELAGRLRGFGMRVLGLKRHPSPELQRELGLDFLGGPESLAFLLQEADFVILALPVTPETRNLMGREAFSRMRPGAFLINVGRGPLIDHDALVEALDRGTLAGAGLDVFWDEPIDPADGLFRYNVIATPHTAGVTDHSYHDIARALAANVDRIREGRPPLHCVNLEEVEKVLGKKGLP